MEFWTDYPIIELGDEPNQLAPVRVAKLLAYDGDKYVTCEVAGMVAVFKSGYLYSRRGRFGEVPTVLDKTLRQYENHRAR